MTLISSISGIRGTVGGKIGQNLTPVDAVKFAAAFATFLRKSSGKERPKIILGRDGRYTGYLYQQLVEGTILSCGADVIRIGLTTTPTIEMAVLAEQADGGIILTASHNPEPWNALKLLNSKGEFISAEAGEEVLHLYQNENFDFVSFEKIGLTTAAYSLPDDQVIASNRDFSKYHIRKILSLPEVNLDAIREAGFRVVADYCTTSNNKIISALLSQLGVTVIESWDAGFSPFFKHSPEPLAENLLEIQNYIKAHIGEIDLGIVVDPDADRLALICENGSFFGEEYTLVAVSEYIIRKKAGAVVSNLSSSRALKDVADRYSCPYYASPVGEVNVVQEMKRVGAVVGGEGNGGIILPNLHYGRDALVGIALFLSYLAESGLKASELRKRYPNYYMVKDKISLAQDEIPQKLASLSRSAIESGEKVNTSDGIKIDFSDRWVHIRPSNTEPIIRIYTEATTLKDAQALADNYKKLLNEHG